MNHNNLIWWTGVVEDRDDPEKLGRCRVRIFNYHTDDVGLLPTKDLPWAIPMQSITSAATSGVGSTPIGIVTGTWVVGFFLDGTDSQSPVIMGTIAGKPTKSEEAKEKEKQLYLENANVLKDINGNIVYDVSGEPVIRPSDTNDTYYYKPLTTVQVSSVIAALGRKLSGGNYSKIGDSGQLGKYQFDAATLINMGYVSRPAGGIVDETTLDNDNYWTGKGGIRSKELFLDSVTVQENLIKELFDDTYKDLLVSGKISVNGDPAIVAGLIATGIVFGSLNADKLDKKNDNGEKARDYFILGNSSLGGDANEFYSKYGQSIDTYIPNQETQSLTNEELAKVKGFQDPNKKYPKYEYSGLTDINKLAVGDRSHLLFNTKDNKRVEKINLAQSAQTWDEPESAFAGNYPYNQVIETECGHVIELDSTPNAERIHVFHKSGSYIEIDVNGTSVRKVVGENYEVFDRNNFVYVKGAQCLTVEGKTSILVKDDCNINVEGDLDVTTNGQAFVQAAGNLVASGERLLVSGKQSLDIVSEGAINMQGSSINMFAKGGAVSLKGNDVNLHGINSTSVKGGIQVMIDAAIVKTKMGANIVRSLAMSILPTPNKKSPDKSQIPVLQRRTPNDDSFLNDSAEPTAQAYAEKRVATRSISDKIVPYATPADVAKPAVNINGPTGKIVQPGCEECDKFNNSFPRSFKLSKNFSLNNMLVGKYGPALVAQRNLEEKDIVCNMIYLAENCLEPIFAKYPDMIISSGFRIGDSTSDHNIGSAVDIVFPNRPLSEVKDIAEWITQNVPFRQCLLEYETIKGSNKIRVAWIHIAFLSKSGQIVKSSKAPVQTFLNHASVYSKLVNLA